MTEEQKDALAEVLERSDFTADTPLDSLGWDSMMMLTVIALAKSRGKTVTGDDLRTMKTIADVCAAI